MENSYLFLLPNTLGYVQNIQNQFTPEVVHIVTNLDGLIAESLPSGIKYLKYFLKILALNNNKVNYQKIEQLPIVVFNKKTPEQELDFILDFKEKGQRWGLISDAGLPCLADPGAKIVQKARALKIIIQALPGPSSITLSLMLSGLNGQSFIFHGYLSKEPKHRLLDLQTWEKHLLATKTTQIFIEAPHRNQQTLEYLIQNLNDEIILCVATNLTTESEKVISLPIQQWKTSSLPSINKQPTIFLFGRYF